MRRDRRRHTAPGYLWAYMQRRSYYIAVILFLVAVVAVLLVVSSSLPDYGKNLSLNISADLIGTIVVLFIIAPFIARAELRRDSVLERFDHRAFIGQAADARYRILILEMWTDLLQGGYRQPFLGSLRAALEQNVEVRILLLDPDARAAEQRADDLLRQTNVFDSIMDNLLVLYEFRHGLQEHLQKNIDIRIYSALPPVQMYRVDDSIVVSFYPVNITSWNAAQYQTSPQAQLGTFVGTKFDELWEAPSTRTLDQFWAITIRVDSGANQRSYRVKFVTSEEETYVCGREVVAGHAITGIGGLPVRVVDDNGTRAGREAVESYSFQTVDGISQDYVVVQDLFSRKYGQSNDDVILKLVRNPHETALNIEALEP